MKKIKVSVIGSGHLGSIHTRLWKSTPNAELIGLYDTDSQRAYKIANENGINIFNSLDNAIQSSDAVTISAPTTFHYDIAEKCIESGVHCLIEKPITSTYNEARKLIELSKNKNLVVQVGHVERFNPALMALKDYNLNPMFIEAHRLSQFKPRAIDVSVILDLMIHDIDIMLWLVKSKVEKIDANGVAVLTDTPDIANARIKFENGAVANLTASRISANPMRKLRMFQSNAYISIDFGNQEVEVFRLLDVDETAEGNAIPANMLGTLEAGLTNKKIVFEKPLVPEINAIAEEQKSFIEAIINGSPAAVSAEEAAEALRIAELISEQIG
ncbi:MAG: Gfo/Idh/MocA family oxidoreductase [Bacteroidetes bacterium]|nr:MAG: Gfo/Idh/MocA family oxidoreductase [Bacteroidota bacterium]